VTQTYTQETAHMPINITYIELTEKTGSVEIAGTEVTLDADGSPITDLKNTKIFQILQSGATKLIHVFAATSRMGGGVIAVTFDVNVEAAQTEIKFRAVASDVSNNVSLPTEFTFFLSLVNDGIAPAAP